MSARIHSGYLLRKSHVRFRQLDESLHSRPIVHLNDPLLEIVRRKLGSRLGSETKEYRGVLGDEFGVDLRAHVEAVVLARVLRVRETRADLRHLLVRTLAASGGGDEPCDEGREALTADVAELCVRSDAGTDRKKAADVAQPSIFESNFRDQSDTQVAKKIRQTTGVSDINYFHLLKRRVVEAHSTIDEGVLAVRQRLEVRRSCGCRASSLPNRPVLLRRRVLRVDLGSKRVRGSILVDVGSNMDGTVVVHIILASRHHKPASAQAISTLSKTFRTRNGCKLTLYTGVR